MEVITLEVAAVGIVIISAIAGACRGFVKTVYQLVKLIIAIALSIALAPIIAALIPKSVTFRAGIAVVLIFVVVSIILSLIGSLLSIVDHIPLVKHINRLLGGIFGFVLGLVFVCILLTIIGMFSKEGLGYELAVLIRKSQVLMWLYQNNPITQFVTHMNLPFFTKA